MIEIPNGASKEAVALMLAKQNHASSIVYLLEKALERMESAKHYEDMPGEEMDFLKDVEAKVKAAHDAMKDWAEENE